MTGIVTAPWTAEQVDSLNDYQQSGAFHPFTCGNDQCRAANRSPLTATPHGWVHPCGYTQNWAHTFMADGSWKPAVTAMQELLLRADAAAVIDDDLDDAS